MDWFKDRSMLAKLLFLLDAESFTEIIESRLRMAVLRAHHAEAVTNIGQFALRPGIIGRRGSDPARVRDHEGCIAAPDGMDL